MFALNVFQCGFQMRVRYSRNGEMRFPICANVRITIVFDIIFFLLTKGVFRVMQIHIGTEQATFHVLEQRLRCSFLQLS